nr:hypothetical protein BaRGS_019038 [Batillaria attramentaria]
MCSIETYVVFSHSTMLLIVVEEVETLYQDIGSVNTLCAVNQDRVSLIEGKYPGLFSLKNRQQDALADLFQAQQASDTSAALHDLQQQLNTETSTNHDQDSQINHLTGELDQCKQQLLQDLEDNVTELCDKVNDTESEVRHVLDFVLSRKCEYGTVSVCPGELGNVTFKTLFDVTPDVSLSLTGFSGHLDGRSYDADCLAFNSTAVDVTTEGFSVELGDGSGGDVTLKHLTYRFMACQNLNEKPDKTEPTEAPTTPTTTLPPCNKADLVFVLDSSESLSVENFEQLKDFVQNISKALTIGPDDVQIGAIKFNSAAFGEFDLNDFANMADVLAAIEGIVRAPGGTRTDLALDLLVSDAFTAPNGDREGIPNIAVVITDGASNEASLTATAAQQAQDAGITLLAVGIGNIDEDELKTIATGPGDDNVFIVDDVDALGSIVLEVWTQICQHTY